MKSMEVWTTTRWKTVYSDQRAMIDVDHGKGWRGDKQVFIILSALLLEHVLDCEGLGVL